MTDIADEALRALVTPKIFAQYHIVKREGVANMIMRSEVEEEARALRFVDLVELCAASSYVLLPLNYERLTQFYGNMALLPRDEIEEIAYSDMNEDD